MIFGLSPIFALIPLLVYIVLAFKDINPVLNVFICVIFSMILTNQSLLTLGSVIASGMESFIAMVGLIILLGSALGAVLKKTGVAEFIVMALTKKIGIDSEKKAILSVMACSILLVSMLGTMAGANAIIAPIVIPLVASIGLTPSALAVSMFGAGMTGLFVGPFTPPTVTVMGLTNIGYGSYLLGAALPVAVIIWVITFFMANYVQKKTLGVYAYDSLEKPNTEYVATKETKNACTVFAVALLGLIALGMYLKSGSSYAILVMFTVSILTGLAARLTLSDIFETMMDGASRLVWLFMMFVLFDPFIRFVSEAGAFTVLVSYLEPLLGSNSKVAFAFISTITGIFGIGGAAVAQAVVIDNMFGELGQRLAVSPTLWASIMLIGSQITSFAYPEADMLGQMGLARSKDLKSMVKFGLTVVAATTLYVTARAIFG